MVFEAERLIATDVTPAMVSAFRTAFYAPREIPPKHYDDTDDRIRAGLVAAFGEMGK